jgi:chromosome segregation ATPase
MSKTAATQGGGIEALDWKCHEILRALAENDGRATTTEISERTGIENNDHILYRFRTKLRPAELVEVTQPEYDGSAIQSKTAILTETGWEAIDRLDEDGENPSRLSDRLDQLDARYTQIESHLDTLTEHIEHIEENNEEHDEDIEALKDGHNELADAIEGVGDPH